MHVVEKNPPPDATAIQWLLFTTVQVASAKQALKCVRWYARRWRIEEWHRVMKSGCKILEHQHRDAGTLLRAIALDAVIAWRIMLLGILGREVPGLPAAMVFDAGECTVPALLSGSKKTLRGLSHDRDRPTRWLPAPRRGWPARFRVFVERIRHPTHHGKNYAAPSCLRIKPPPTHASQQIGGPCEG